MQSPGERCTWGSLPEAKEVADLLVLGLGRDVLDVDSRGRHFDFACGR